MKLAVLITLVVISLSPIYPQCEQREFARANPGLCSASGPFGSFPQGGGGGGGLLGTLGKVLHDLTGGLL